jgi:hypothetical protein
VLAAPCGTQNRAIETRESCRTSAAVPRRHHGAGGAVSTVAARRQNNARVHDLTVLSTPAVLTVTSIASLGGGIVHTEAFRVFAVRLSPDTALQTSLVAAQTKQVDVYAIARVLCVVASSRDALRTLPARRVVFARRTLPTKWHQRAILFEWPVVSLALALATVSPLTRLARRLASLVLEITSYTFHARPSPGPGFGLASLALGAA